MIFFFSNKPSSCTGDVDFEFGDVEITDRPYVIELNSADEVAANCSSLGELIKKFDMFYPTFN